MDGQWARLRSEPHRRRLKVTIYNGDNFEHGYMNVDFGGARGWENQFKSFVKVGGSGCWFTFGRAHWWMNIPNTEPTPNNRDGDLLVNLAGNFSRDYFVENVEHETEVTPNPGVYPRLSLGPGQRFASKGSYIVKVSDRRIEAASDWIIP